MLAGVCVHPGWSDTIYREHAKILDAVQSLGVTVTRGVGVSDRAWVKVCHERGLKVIIVADTAIPDVWWASELAERLAAFPGTIIAVEGLNEPDLDDRLNPGWPAYTLQHQTALRAQVTGVPLLAPSIGHAENYPLAPVLSGLCDVANVHHYDDGDIKANYAAARAVAGVDTVWVTETDDLEQHQTAEVACRYQLCAPAKRHSFLWWTWWQQDWPDQDRYGLFRVTSRGELIAR